MKHHLQLLMSWSNLDLLFQKTGLVKLQSVMRAIRKLFPHTPHDLDNPDSCEKTHSKIYYSMDLRKLSSMFCSLVKEDMNYEALKNSPLPGCLVHCN
jgi:hypothetical protein